MKGKKVFSIIGILVGVLSIVFSIIMFGQTVGSLELNHTYAGDAYTGIQNAAAQAANNVRYLAQAFNTGSGLLFLVFGLFLICLFGGKLSECGNAENKATPIVANPVAVSQPPAAASPQSAAPAFQQPEAPVFPQPVAIPVAEPAVPVKPEGMVGRCEMCGAQDIMTRKVEIAGAAGVRYRHVCNGCIDKYHLTLAQQ